MIVDPKNISQYLPSVNFKVDSVRFVPYLQEAEMDITDKILGCEIADMLANSENEDLNELKNLACRAISITAYLNAIPEMDLQLSEAGLVVASNEAFKPASKERVERLMESLRRRKSAALDSLLVFLVHNSIDDASPVKDWRGSRQFAYFSQTPIFTLAKFENFSLDLGVNIKMDWDKFYSVIPVMNETLRSEVAYYVSNEYIDNVMERLRDAEPILVIEKNVVGYIRRAIVSAALGKKELIMEMSIKARNIMLSNIDQFPIFYKSDSYRLPENSLAGTGGVSNFLV